MAFQSPTAPGRRVFLELQNETKSSLAYRSHSDLSNLCRSVGIPSEGTSSELISSLLNLKLNNESSRDQTSALSSSFEQTSNNASWLNRPGLFSADEESLGIPKLNLNKHLGSVYSNNNPNHAPPPLPIPPAKQPNENAHRSPFSAPFPEFSKYESTTQPTNPTFAVSKPSPRVLGPPPDYLNKKVNNPTYTANNPFTEQARTAASKMDNKAEHISLTIETEDLSGMSTQKSPTIPFPFPIKEESHGNYNQQHTGLQNNPKFQVGSLPNLGQLPTGFTQNLAPEVSNERDSNLPTGQTHNPFLIPSEVPNQHSNIDQVFVSKNPPALIQTTEMDSNKTSTSMGSFSPVNAGSTQGTMPWIQMNWGSPPARQGSHQLFYNPKVTPPNQTSFPNHIGKPNYPQQNGPEFRRNQPIGQPIGQQTTASPPNNGGFPYNPFEHTRKTSLVPEQRQLPQLKEFLPNQSNIQQIGFAPSREFIPSQPAGQYLNLGHNQPNARINSNHNLINLASPPEHLQMPNWVQLNLTEPHKPHFNLSPVDNNFDDHLIPQEILTQSNQSSTAGKSLLFQSLWDHDGSHPNKKNDTNPLPEPTSFSPPNHTLIQHSQMTSPESAMTSGFNSYTSHGFENPVSITTDWAASPRTSDVILPVPEPGPGPGPVPEPLPNPVPVPAQASAPAHAKLVPITHIEDLLIQETGESISLIPFSDLQIGRQIGTGGYKDCFAGTYKGEIVAIGELKVTQFTKEDFLEIKNEVNVLKQVYHENIVRFIGIAKGPEKLCIITEFCQKGDLFDQFRRDPKPSFEIQIQIMYDIALGVAYLHARRPSIIHRDLKSMNILINKDGKAKINDFGLARIRSRVRSIAHTQCGTPNWQAPEIFAAKPSYTEKVDVYAVGLIFWEILQWGAQPFPFSDIPESSLEIAIRDKRLRPSFNHIQFCPAQLYQLIVQMWDHEATARPSMAIVVDQLGQLLD